MPEELLEGTGRSPRGPAPRAPLEEGSKAGGENAEAKEEEAVREWLRADFTELQARRKVTTFRSVGAGPFRGALRS